MDWPCSHLLPGSNLAPEGPSRCSALSQTSRYSRCRQHHPHFIAQPLKQTPSCTPGFQVLFGVALYTINILIFLNDFLCPVTDCKHVAFHILSKCFSDSTVQHLGSCENADSDSLGGASDCPALTISQDGARVSSPAADHLRYPHKLTTSCPPSPIFHMIAQVLCLRQALLIASSWGSTVTQTFTHCPSVRDSHTFLLLCLKSA